MGFPSERGGRRPKKPRRDFRGIAAVWSGGRWVWRACLRVRERTPIGEVQERQVTGPYRTDQRLAYEDAERLRGTLAAKRGKRWTVLAGINAAIQAKVDEGLAPYSIERGWRHPARRILKRFRGDAALESITVDIARTWALHMLDVEKLAGPTAKKYRLLVLHKAFLCAGLESPIPEVIRQLGKRLARVHKTVRGYDVDAAQDLLERARAWRSPHGRPTPNLELDILVMELAATTGIRHDELSRLRRRDIDLELRVIHVTSKVRSLPRMEPILDEVLPRLAARVAELGKPDAPLIPGYGEAKATQNAWEPQNRWLNRHRERWKKRLGDKRFHLRALRRAHGSGLDELGASYAIIRDALGHTRTSGETPRYLLTHERAVNAAKQRLATHLLPPAAPGPAQDPGADSAPASDAPPQ
jgi:integrase